MAAVGLLLAIACANVGNLMLVRAEGRQQELAARAALGAGWTAITRELLLECVTLSAFSGVVGLAAGHRRSAPAGEFPAGSSAQAGTDLRRWDWIPV